MGESKRKKQAEENMTPYEKMLHGLIQKLMDEGLLIEAGWVGLRKVWFKEAMPQDVVDHCRMAFMAGAAHLYASMMNALETPGNDEPTANDLRRMELIHNELMNFNNELKLRQPGAMKGSA